MNIVALRRERLPAEIRVLVGAGFVVAIGYGIVAPALPEFARSFDVGVTAASAVVSGFALFRVLFAPVSGRLLHQVGEIPVFCSGVLVVGGSSAACAFATGYGQLLIFRAILMSSDADATVNIVDPMPARARHPSISG